MPRLHAVPHAAERVLGLIRVSKERDGMVSPEVQQAAITSYSAARGYEITGWLEGLDESGSRSRSAWWPRLEQAVAAVEAGEYDVIVVWKYSRTARHRLRWAVALDRVETAGGRLESATEQVDVTTSTGRFTRGMLAELNAFEAERIGEVWKEVHARRIRDGRPASGKPRYGYTYDHAQKLHVPDPVTGPLLADLYRRYVAGESFYALVRWLNARGHRTLAGGLWELHKLRRVMDNGFASGQFVANGELHPGVHEPLVDADLWQAYLDERARRAAAPPRRERSQYVLSGLVRCARCRRPMVAGQFNRGVIQYRCKAGAQGGATACRGGYVNGNLLEEKVLGWLTGLAGEIEDSRAAALAARARRTTVRHEAARLARQVARAEEALTRLALQHAETPLPAEVYRSAHAELTAQLNQLQEALEDAGRESRRAVANPGKVAKDLLAGWEERPVAQRRQVLETLLAYVEVTTGRPRAREIRIVPSWEEEQA